MPPSTRIPVAAARRVPAYKQPAVLGLFALVLLAALFYSWQSLARWQAAAAERADLMDSVRRAVELTPVDSDELSRLVAGLQRLPDAATARDVAVALARIEFARGRADRAAELLGPLVNQPGAAPAEQRLAAAVWLRRHELGAADRSAAVALLEQAIGFADQAYADGNDPNDLQRAWLAALRLGDSERAQRYASQLQADHAGAPAAALAQLLASASLTTPRTDIEAVLRRFDEPPAELEVLLATVLLQAGEMQAAVAAMEPVLRRAPGVVEVRRSAALLFHVCVLSSEAGPARQPWVVRRDTQLDWLIAQAAADDPGRAGWAAMRQER